MGHTMSKRAAAGVPSCAQVWQNEMRLRKAQSNLVAPTSVTKPRFRTALSPMQSLQADLARRDSLRQDVIERRFRNAKAKSDAGRIRALMRQVNALKQDKETDVQLIQNLVDANEKHTEEIEKQRLIKQEVDERNVQLIADREPLQFEITRMRERNTNLQRELTAVRSRNSRAPDHSSIAKCLQTQNALLKSRLQTLMKERNTVQTKHAEEIDALKKQISNLQCQVRTSVLNWQRNLRNQHANIDRVQRPVTTNGNRKSLTGFRGQRR